MLRTLNGVGRRTQDRIAAAQHEVATVLARASTLDEAAPSVLRAIGEAAGWSHGALWTADGDGLLRPAGAWQSTPGEDGFTAATRKTRLPPGEGLPGRVFLNGQPV